MTAKRLKKARLYEVEFTPLYNKNIVPLTEYFKSKLTTKELQKALLDTLKPETSLYYGYTDVNVKQVKDVQELMTIKVNLNDS